MSRRTAFPKSEPSLQQHHLFPKTLLLKLVFLLYKILNEQIDI